MSKIDINSSLTGNALFTHETEGNTIKLTLEAAVSARANLAGADLARADLAGADLAGANLARADLARADLARANLAGASLAGADIDSADIDGEKLTEAPLSLLNLRWPVLITGQYMRIGCQRHTHEEWAAMNDAAINRMNDGALEFWREWRNPLLALCEQYRKNKGGVK